MDGLMGGRMGRLGRLDDWKTGRMTGLTSDGAIGRL